MNDDELLRYSRQIMLPQIGIEGQQRLADSRALIIGAGGLGSPAAMYLAAAGVGELVIVDDDVVELSNLQRQILHTAAAVGRAKVDSARDTLLALNPLIRVTPVGARLDDQALREQVGQADVVLDCSDNFATRFAVNTACVATRTALVSGAAIRFEGQLTVFQPGLPDSPCYRCLYSESSEDEELLCSENGVLAPVVGNIGTLQAVEAIKLLAGIGDSLCGRLLMFDALHMEWRSMRFRRDPDCPVCGTT
ncbi:MAG: molybdopterin-synthase adenylyltransferase MoeB [Granulosicoccaceae bacterium]|jgi:adenylyltransferase/sulfurtransferase